MENLWNGPREVGGGNNHGGEVGEAWWMRGGSLASCHTGISDAFSHDSLESIRL